MKLDNQTNQRILESSALLSTDDRRGYRTLEPMPISFDVDVATKRTHQLTPQMIRGCEELKALKKFENGILKKWIGDEFDESHVQSVVNDHNPKYQPFFKTKISYDMKGECFKCTYLIKDKETGEKIRVDFPDNIPRHTRVSVLCIPYSVYRNNKEYGMQFFARNVFDDGRDEENDNVFDDDDDDDEAHASQETVEDAFEDQ